MTSDSGGNSIKEGTPGKPRRQFDHNIEGIRGLACLVVLLGHGVMYLDPSVTFPNLIRFFPNAHAAVLLFFVLSGYVIGLTNTVDFSGARCRKYLERRVVRLVPIYLFAVGLAFWVIAPDSIQQVLGNLFFLQNTLTEFPGVRPPKANMALWSLNYEAVFYLLFLLVWLLRVRLDIIVSAGLLLEIGCYLTDYIPDVLGSYGIGMIFWSVGLWLAWKTPVADEGDPVAPHPYISYLFLFSSILCFNSMSHVMQRLGYRPHPWVCLTDLAYLPLCYLVIATAARRRAPLLGLARGISFAIPAAGVVLYLAVGRGLNTTGEFWFAGTVYFFIAAALVFIRNTPLKLARVAFWGRISYALYAIHLPLVFLVDRHFPWSGTWGAYLARAIVWILPTVLLAYLLERVLQPKITQWRRARSV